MNSVEQERSSTWDGLDEALETLSSPRLAAMAPAALHPLHFSPAPSVCDPKEGWRAASDSGSSHK